MLNREQSRSDVMRTYHSLHTCARTVCLSLVLAHARYRYFPAGFCIWGSALPYPDTKPLDRPPSPPPPPSPRSLLEGLAQSTCDEELMTSNDDVKKGGEAGEAWG